MAPSAALEGATISVGSRNTTSDVNGHFELTGLPEGSATVRAERPGYVPSEATVSIAGGTTTHDFALAANEIYEFGPTAVYVPAGVGPIRAVIVTLGGPNTAGFVTGRTIVTGNPNVETSLQSLGLSLRVVAKFMHVALLGWTVPIGDGGGSDTQIFDALGTVAALSGHPEIADAPVLTFGFSAGGREASGLVARNPGRAIGLVGRVPGGATPLTDPAALAVPTLLMQAEIDPAVDNAATKAIFQGNRAQGGLWALVVEPGVDHDTASAEGNGTATNWIVEVLTLRLPATPGDPLIALAETSGWLGDQTTLEIASWATYTGTRNSASWLPSQATALGWQNLGTSGGGGGGGGDDVARRPGQ